MPSVLVLVLLGLLVLTGAAVQSTLGFGIAVVAAPFVVALAPELMPGSLLVLGFLLPLVQLSSGLRDISWALLAHALGWRVLLTPVGVWLVAVLPTAGIAIAVALLVAISVVASVRGLETTATPRHAAVAGALTGISGTAAAIGGPFFALVLQHEPATRVRATLAAFFLGGSSVSLVGLGISGLITREQLVAAAWWAPMLIAGHLLAGPVRARVDGERMRLGVLALCLVAAVGVVVQQVVIA